MKKLIYTLLAVSIIFSACKKEEGCTDPTATNYNADAEKDDGSCIAVILGCTDNAALNFDPSANTDDGSCIDLILGCMDEIATNYNALATVDDGLCEYGITGGKWMGTSESYDLIITLWDSSQSNTLGTFPYSETENNPDSLSIQQIKFFLNNLEVKTYTNQGLIENEGNWVEENEGTTNHSITITDDGEIIIFNVENITENNLVLSQSIDEMEYDEYDNTWVHFTGTVDYSFDRDKNGLTSNGVNQRKGKSTWSDKNKLMTSIKKK